MLRLVPKSSEYCLRPFQMEEWDSLELPQEIEFTQDDQALLAKLHDEDVWKVVIDELISGIRFRSRSWVGVIRFRNFEVRIVPKLPGPVNNVMRMLAYSLDLGKKSFKILDSRHDVINENRSLLEIIVLMLVDECERLVRKGLLKDYVEHEDALPYIRGRLLIDKQVLTRFGQLDRLECRYDERSTDIDENRLIVIALAFAVRHISTSDLLVRTRRLHGLFGELCTVVGVDLQTLKSSITYDRRNSHYKEAHRLAILLLDSLGISDMYQGTSSCYAFLFDMNRLFETFVGKWLKKYGAGSSFRLEEQRRFQAAILDADTGKTYSSVIPDFVLTHLSSRQALVVADAKYKLYDERRLSSGDIYQAFTYAYALADDSRPTPPRALIFYPSPALKGQAFKTLSIQKTTGAQGAEVTALGVNIQEMLDYLDSDQSLPSREEQDQTLREILKINN